MEWICHLDGGPKRVNHAAVAVGDVIYSFGGYCYGTNFKQKDGIDVHAFNTLSWRWEKLETTPVWGLEDTLETSPPRMPFKRYGHSVVVYDGRVYLWGGTNDHRVCNTLFCFDPKTRHWSVPEIRTKEAAPPAYEGHSACVVRNKMYIFGGFENGALRFSQDIYAFDFETFGWRHILLNSHVVPQHRDFHSAVVIGDDMYVFGGRSDEAAPRYTGGEVYPIEMYKFDTKAEVWSEFGHCVYPPNLQGRRSATAFAYEGNLYITCGYNGNERRHYNDFYKFNVRDEVWTEVKPKGTRPLPRRRMVCCVLDNRVFFFGGTGPRRFSSYFPDVPDEDELGLLEWRGLEDYGDVFILDMKPSLRTMSMMSVLKNRLDRSCLPWDVKCELDQILSENAGEVEPKL